MQSLANCFMAVLGFLIRPKISENAALAIVQEAATKKGWQVHLEDIERYLGLYMGIGFIVGTEITVIWMVDGRRGTLLQLERSDEPNDDAESLV